MKPRLGVMKLGANITWSKAAKTASNFDIQSLCDLLKAHYEIVLISRRTRNTIVPKGMIFQDINEMKDINSGGFDTLLIFNGSINFYGGQECKDQILIYYWLNKFNGKVKYVLTDGQLIMKQIWPAIACKEWHTNWNEEDLIVTRPIDYISQGRNIQKLLSHIQKSKGVTANSISHYPLDEAILCSDFNIEFQRRTQIYDFVYGGAPRSGARKKKLEKFYVHKEFTTYFFGAMNQKHMSRNDNLVFGSKVRNTEFIKELTRANATVIIGDDFYNANFFTLRMYESVLAGILVFIDEAFDPQHLFYKGNGTLEEFMYVGSKQELVLKYKSVRDHILEITALQYEHVMSRFNATHFVNGLRSEINV